MSITPAQVEAAAAGELEASAAVVKATEPIITYLARTIAGEMYRDNRRADAQEDLESVGRLAVWENLLTWKGTASFTTYMRDVVHGAMRDSARSESAQGADEQAVKVFVRMFKKADGDAHLAERMCLTVPPAGQRLSAGRAQAARLAFQGAHSLDVPAVSSGYGDNNSTQTVGELIPADLQGNTVPADLQTADDLNSAQRALRREYVHMALEGLSELRASVLRARMGFDGFPRGTAAMGVNGDVMGNPSAEVAEWLSISPKTERQSWLDGCAQFKSLFPLWLAYPEADAA